MNESLPDPTLPIFGEATVSYTIMHTRQEPDSLGQGGDTAWEHVEVPVDEIDTLENASLREALWKQFCARQSSISTPLLLPFVKPDGTHTSNVWVSPSPTQSERQVFVSVNEDTGSVRSFSAPTRFLGEVFTLDGPIKHEDYPAYLEKKHQEKAARQKSASFISRIFRKNR